MFWGSHYLAPQFMWKYNSIHNDPLVTNTHIKVWEALGQTCLHFQLYSSTVIPIYESEREKTDTKRDNSFLAFYKFYFSRTHSFLIIKYI